MTINELLETVPAEVREAIEEIEHRAGTIDADWEFVKAAGELLAAAKAASVLPVEVVDISMDGVWKHGCLVDVLVKGRKEEGLEFVKWLRERMKDTTTPAT